MDALFGVEGVEREEQTAADVGDERFGEGILGRKNVGAGAAAHVLHHDLRSIQRGKPT